LSVNYKSMFHLNVRFLNYLDLKIVM